MIAMKSPSRAQAQHQQLEPSKMLLGKRPRPPRAPSLRRTTSMGGIVALEADDIDDQEPVPAHDDPQKLQPAINVTGEANKGFEHEERNLVMSPSSSCSSATASSNVNSPHVMPTPHFLRTCGLCKRALPPSGRDIYMYSLECREKQMRQDERKEKCKVQPSNKQVHSPSPSSTTTL